MPVLQHSFTPVIAVVSWDRHQNKTLLAGSELGPHPALVESLTRALRGESFGERIRCDDRDLECNWLPVQETGGALAVFCDVTEYAALTAALSQRFAFEKLITSLSTHFINLNAAAIDAGISLALARLGEFAGVDRTYIFRFNEDGQTMSNTHEWCALGIEPQIQILQNLDFSIFQWSIEQLRKHEVLYVPDIAKLPPEAAAEQASFKEQAIQSLVLVPMVSERTSVGFVGFDAVRSRKTWSNEDIALLRIVGEMFVNALTRQRADEARHALECQLILVRSLDNVAKLAGGVAHDFNNLLSVILNYSTILRQHLHGTELAECVDELFASAKQAADITRQLLIVGRRGINDTTILDVNEVVRNLEPLIRRTLGESNVVEFKLSDGVGLVQLGAPHLEQVIINLVMNARDAMPQYGELCIETDTLELSKEAAKRYLESRPGRYVQLSVRDTGVGMTSEIAARAFEPFFTTKVPEGTGLGLSTVYGIAKQAGGFVALDTKPQQGTCVQVHFPVLANASLPEPAQVPPLLRGQGQLILVVEDSIPLRQLICRQLTENGYRTLESHSPEHALQLCAEQAQEIALLLTDLVMPRISGLVLAQTARDQFAIARVAYMSGYASDVIGLHGELKADDGLLHKPFLEADLLRFVQSALEAPAQVKTAS